MTEKSEYGAWKVRGNEITNALKDRPLGRITTFIAEDAGEVKVWRKYERQYVGVARLLNNSETPV